MSKAKTTGERIATKYLGWLNVTRPRCAKAIDRAIEKATTIAFKMGLESGNNDYDPAKILERRDNCDRVMRAMRWGPTCATTGAGGPPSEGDVVKSKPAKCRTCKGTGLASSGVPSMPMPCPKCRPAKCNRKKGKK